MILLIIFTENNNGIVDSLLFLCSVASNRYDAV